MGHKMTSVKMSRAVFIIGFLLPSLLLYSIFVFYPNILSVYYSFFKWDGISITKTFVGLHNFERLFTDDKVFYAALWHNIVFLILAPVVTLVASIFFAISLTQKKFKENGIYKVIFYFPNILSIVLVGMIWIFVYSPRSGLLNNMLVAMGFVQFEGTAWLGNPQTALLSLVFPLVWGAVGFYMILFIAAINGIPRTLYEAAEMDGANQWHQSIYITMPLIWDVLKIAITFLIITTFASYQLILITTGGGPLGATEVLGTYMIGFITNKSFMTANRDIGYASAVGLVIFVIIMIVTLLQYVLMKRDRHQY